MAKASRQFQVFAKPTGSICNLACDYCYYLEKEHLYPEAESFRMPDDILEAYIRQHIDASPGSVIHFTWHGGEPTLLGLETFRNIVALQRKHKPPGRSITNNIQTNGILIDEAWCRFLSDVGFSVGLSLDGPQEMHDTYRFTRGGKPTHEQAMRGYQLLQQHRVPCDILCVVSAANVLHPTRVYGFFKQIKAQYVGFIPLVERRPETEEGVSRRSITAEAWGDFLRTVYDEWLSRDIGRIQVQIFEEAARTALGYEHALCIFRETCGDVPVIEHNGDVFSCDHYVDRKHRLGNIKETPLVDLIESPSQRAFGHAKSGALPSYCQRCDVLAMCHGGCPKDRFIRTPDGEAGLNYLCSGYKRFFKHLQPFVKELTELRRRQSPEGPRPPDQATAEGPRTKIGRNDPCPCGSGRKFKKCCLGK